MKKPAILCLLLACTLSVSAQSKKEMQDTINQLNQQVGELKAAVAMKTEQLEQANATIAELLQQLAKQQTLQQSAAKAPANYRDSIAVVLEKYINSDTWEERARYVMEPERVKPLMRKFYQTNSFVGATVTTEEIVKGRFRKCSGNNHTIYIWDTPGLNGWADKYIVKTPDGYKIDWEANIHYNAVTAQDLIAKPGKSAVVRQLNLYLDKTYINDWFYKFGYEGETMILAKKDSAAGKKLYSLLKNDAMENMTVKMQSQLDGDYVYLEILDLVSTTLSTY